MLARLLTWQAQGLDPEAAHGLALRTVALAGAPGPFLPPLSQLAARLVVPDQYEKNSLRHSRFGRNLPSLVGLAGGADKNGMAIAGWPRIGFGFAELGTVTFHPRAGNPERPRIVRYPDFHALSNFMGLPNEGYEVLLRNIEIFRAGETGAPEERFCLGISLSRQNGDTLEQLQEMVRKLAPVADYFTLNVSCPNVPSHSELDAMTALSANIEELQAMKRVMRETWQSPRRPVLIKLAPTMDLAALAVTARTLSKMGADGFVATNTVAPKDRNLLLPILQPDGWTQGGYSGPGLLAIGTGMVSTIRKAVPNAIVIGVGGIQRPADALAYVAAGANAVQLYTALTYQGPPLIRALNKAVATHRRPG